MADGRRNNGGARPGAGRPRKADEEKLIAKLSELDDMAFEVMRSAIKKGDYKFWNKFMEYRYGKPKESININPDNDFNIPVIKFFGED